MLEQNNVWCINFCGHGLSSGSKVTHVSGKTKHAVLSLPRKRKTIEAFFALVGSDQGNWRGQCDTIVGSALKTKCLCEVKRLNCEPLWNDNLEGTLVLFGFAVLELWTEFAIRKCNEQGKLMTCALIHNHNKNDCVCVWKHLVRAAFAIRNSKSGILLPSGVCLENLQGHAW